MTGKELLEQLKVLTEDQLDNEVFVGCKSCERRFLLFKIEIIKVADCINADDECSGYADECDNNECIDYNPNEVYDLILLDSED